MKKSKDAFGIDEYGFAEYPKKMSYVRILRLENQLKCSYCKPHKGCNSKYKDQRSWKEHRDSQYKNEAIV